MCIKQGQHFVYSAVPAVDAKYFRMAEDSLYGELAVALDMNRKELEEYIAGEVERTQNKVHFEFTKKSPAIFLLQGTYIF